MIKRKNDNKNLKVILQKDDEKTAKKYILFMLSFAVFSTNNINR